MIGPRRKTKRYDKKKRENELEKLRLENIEMLQKKPEKSNLKLYSNIRVIPIQPKKEEVSIMDSGQTFTEEELKKNQKLKKLKVNMKNQLIQRTEKQIIKTHLKVSHILLKVKKNILKNLKEQLIILLKEQ